ncbi:MAG: hypothetical protein IKR40_06230 [Treponema sp.]|nr:hypothetical protein [Treponema sp.]
MSNIFSMPYAVDSAFIDGKLRFTLVGMSTWAQTLVSFHYGEHGLTIPHMGRRGLTWVVTKQHFEISEYPEWKDDLLLESWMEEVRGLFSLYDFRFSYADGGKKSDWETPLICRTPGAERKKGQTFMNAKFQWMLLDLETLRPVPMDSVDFGNIGFCSETSCITRFPKIALPEKFSFERTFTPQRLEIDLNGHVNNTEYLKYVLNSVPDEICSSRLVSSLDTNFISSAHYGDTLTCRTTVIEEECKGDEICAVHSIIRSDGSEVFRAKTVWRPESAMSRGLWTS